MYITIPEKEHLIHTTFVTVFGRKIHNLTFNALLNDLCVYRKYFYKTSLLKCDVEIKWLKSDFLRGTYSRE